LLRLNQFVRKIPKRLFDYEICIRAPALSPLVFGFFQRTPAITVSFGTSLWNRIA
jgi:hypothetical protein